MGYDLMGALIGGLLEEKDDMDSLSSWLVK